MSFRQNLPAQTDWLTMWANRKDQQMQQHNDYAVEFPTGEQGIEQALRVAAYAGAHSPTSQEGARVTVLAMFMRTFDRFGGTPLPQNWRTAILPQNCPYGNAQCKVPGAPMGYGVHADCLDAPVDAGLDPSQRF